MPSRNCGPVSGEEAFSPPGDGAVRTAEDGENSPQCLERSACTDKPERVAEQRRAAAANHSAGKQPRALTVLRPRPLGSVGPMTTKTKLVHGVSM